MPESYTLIDKHESHESKDENLTNERTVQYLAFGFTAISPRGSLEETLKKPPTKSLKRWLDDYSKKSDKNKPHYLTGINEAGEIEVHRLLQENQPTHIWFPEGKEAERTWKKAQIGPNTITVMVVNDAIDLSGLPKTPNSKPEDKKTPQGTFLLPPYSETQEKAIVELAKDIVARHNIHSTDVLGLYDFKYTATSPGPQFPWKPLADAGIGTWYDEEAVDKLAEELKQLDPKKDTEKLELLKPWLETVLQHWGHRQIAETPREKSAEGNLEYFYRGVKRQALHALLFRYLNHLVKYELNNTTNLEKDFENTFKFNELFTQGNVPTERAMTLMAIMDDLIPKYRPDLEEIVIPLREHLKLPAKASDDKLGCCGLKPLFQYISSFFQNKTAETTPLIPPSQLQEEQNLTYGAPGSSNR